MNDQRPTRWPWSADSSRKAGSAGASARSLRNADTGVSVSAMNVRRSGTRLYAPDSSRTSASEGATEAPSSAATGIQDPLGVGERPVAAAQQDEQVVQHVG